MDLQRQGKIRHIGLSEVSVAKLAAVGRLATIVSVQNRYNLTDRHSEDVLDACTREGIGFIPWFPLATGSLATPAVHWHALPSGSVRNPAKSAIAWLLRKSPVMLPIPGTSRVEHLEENTASGLVQLDDAIVAELERSK